MSVTPRTYRVYTFDRARTAVSADLIRAATDEEAVAAAEASALGHKCEVWDERRLVARLDAERRLA